MLKPWSSLFSNFSRHGIPARILTDCGSNFTSKLFQALCKQLGIKHILTTPYRQNTNGCLERWHSTLKRCYILFGLREAPNRVTGYAPFTLLYGREVRGPVAILAETRGKETPKSKTIQDLLEETKRRLSIAQEAAAETDEQSKQYNKFNYDKQAHAHPLKIGDEVLVRIPTDPKGLHAVSDTPTNVTYTLNAPYKGKKNRTFHRNSLKLTITTK